MERQIIFVPKKTNLLLQACFLSQKKKKKKKKKKFRLLLKISVRPFVTKQIIFCTKTKNLYRKKKFLSQKHFSSPESDISIQVGVFKKKRSGGPILSISGTCAKQDATQWMLQKRLRGVKKVVNYHISIMGRLQCRTVILFLKICFKFSFSPKI